MALKIPVKVNNVNNLTDARYCAGMGVSMIGFYMDANGKNALSPQKVIELTSWISGVKKVGEFEGESIEDDLKIAKSIELDFIQFNTLNPKIKELDFPIIQKIVIDKTSILLVSNILREYVPYVSYFIIESHDFEITQIAGKIREWISIAPIILGFGIQSKTLDFILNDLKPAGISINGGDEIRPGFKDLDELIDILEALEVEE